MIANRHKIITRKDDFDRVFNCGAYTQKANSLYAKMQASISREERLAILEEAGWHKFYHIQAENREIYCFNINMWQDYNCVEYIFLSITEEPGLYYGKNTIVIRLTDLGRDEKLESYFRCWSIKQAEWENARPFIFRGGSHNQPLPPNIVTEHFTDLSAKEIIASVIYNVLKTYLEILFKDPMWNYVDKNTFLQYWEDITIHIAFFVEFYRNDSNLICKFSTLQFSKHKVNCKEDDERVHYMGYTCREHQFSIVATISEETEETSFLNQIQRTLKNQSFSLYLVPNTNISGEELMHCNKDADAFDETYWQKPLEYVTTSLRCDSCYRMTGGGYRAGDCYKDHLQWLPRDLSKTLALMNNIIQYSYQENTIKDYYKEYCDMV